MKLEVRVYPKASRNAVETAEDGRLKVYVTAPPEGGRANDAVISLVAKRLGVAKGTVQVLTGHKSRRKVLLVEGLTLREAFSRLESTSR